MNSNQFATTGLPNIFVAVKTYVIEEMCISVLLAMRLESISTTLKISFSDDFLTPNKHKTKLQGQKLRYNFCTKDLLINVGEIDMKPTTECL